jgi:hypothetical protein
VISEIRKIEGPSSKVVVRDETIDDDDHSIGLDDREL